MSSRSTIFRLGLLVSLLLLASGASAFAPPLMTPKQGSVRPTTRTYYHSSSASTALRVSSATVPMYRKKEDELKAQRKLIRNRTLSKYKRWRSYRERTMNSMGWCYKLLCLSAVLDFVVQGVETRFLMWRKWTWNTDTVWILLDTLWKITLGLGLWRVHASFRRWGPVVPSSPPLPANPSILPHGDSNLTTTKNSSDTISAVANWTSNLTFPWKEDEDMTVRDRIEDSLTVLAFLWRKTAWVILTGAILDLWALWGAHSMLLWASVGLMGVGKGLVRWIHHRQTHMFLRTGTGSPSTLRVVGLKAVRNMAFCTYALIVQGLVESLLALVRSAVKAAPTSTAAATPVGPPSVSFPTTPFWAAALLWNMRRAFFRTVIANSESNEDDSDHDDENESALSGTAQQGVDFLLVNNDLLEAQDKFYATVSTAITSEVLAKGAWLVVTGMRAVMDPAALAALATRSF